MSESTCIDDGVILSEAVRLVNEGVEVTFPVNGRSMRPFIEGGRDSVVLVKPGEVKRLDVVLARTDTGRFVVHRIVSLDGGRVFRGLLTTALTEHRSALITVIVSRVISIGMVMYTLCGAIIGTGSVADVLIQLPISALIWWACRTDDVGTENDDQIDSATFPCGIIDDSLALNIAISTQNAECEYVLH